MTDVFIRAFSSSELRLGFAIATVARWKMQKDVRPVVLWCTSSMAPAHDWGCETHILQNSPELPFATQSLQWAERKTFSDPYIICNDDNLIYGQDFVEKGLKLMNEHPDFGIIAARFVNEAAPMTEELQEIHAVGGLVFLRKGLVTEFKPLEDCHWDCYRHEQIKAKGFKSGFARDLPYLHMGAKFSIANSGHYTGA